MGPHMPRYVKRPHLQVDTLDLHLIGLKCGSKQLCLHTGQRDIHLQCSAVQCVGPLWQALPSHPTTTQHPPGTGTPHLKFNMCQGMWSGIAPVPSHLHPTTHTTPCKGKLAKLLGAVQQSTAWPLTCRKGPTYSP